MVGTNKTPCTSPPSSSSSSPNDDQYKSEDLQKRAKNHAKATKKPAAAAPWADVNGYKSLRRMPWRHIRVSWESFPYYLCKTTEELLLSAAHLHLVRKKKKKKNMASSSSTAIIPPCLSRLLLLSGPQGSEMYQKRLAMALANKFNATLLIFDPLPQLQLDPLSADGFRVVLTHIKHMAMIVHHERSLSLSLSLSTAPPPVVVFLSDIFLKDVERFITLSFEMEQALERIPAGVLVIGSQVLEDDDGKEEKPPRPAGDLSTWPQPKLRSKLFPNKIDIRMPQDKAQRVTWKHKLDKDAEVIRARRNNATIRSTLARSGWSCKDLEKIWIKDRKLTDEFVSQMVGYAILNHLQKDGDAEDDAEDHVLSSESIKHGFRLLEDINRADKITNSLKADVVTDNDYEKQLLADVIPPDELGVSFDDVGALDNVKDALRESVMLPLQRPELFSQGQLMKPCKGILLFGPPGTGKTMLAKAVATEAGANFINVSVSSITSMWYGEAEKYAKAVFTLASKIAPAVVFIDEVDSMLSDRGSYGESEASRRLKNEFMTNWDGLRTKDEERVLVLAATNRPFDLDEAVVRRFPRRLMVGLPEAPLRRGGTLSD